MIPWRYPILFDLIVIGSRQIISFILSLFSPVSIRSEETVVCHSNILWLKIIHYEFDVKLTTVCESVLCVNVNGRYFFHTEEDSLGPSLHSRGCWIRWKPVVTPDGFGVTESR